MADKISTLVLDVDLQCHKCYKKIKKAVCKCREIKSQNFDEKQNKVILSGPFDPEKLIKKLYGKVCCKIIKGYEIKKPEKDKKPEEGKNPEDKKDKKPEEGKKPEDKKNKKPEEDKKPEDKKDKKPPNPVMGVPIGWRVFCMECYEWHEDGYCKRRGCHRPVCCKECYEGHDDGYYRRGGCHRPVCCRECYEGHGDGYCKGGSGCRYFSSYGYFSVEDSACTTM